MTAEGLDDGGIPQNPFRAYQAAVWWGLLLGCWQDQDKKVKWIIWGISMSQILHKTNVY